MKTYSALKVAFAAGGMALLMTSCGITGGSNGDEKAAMSCMQDIATGLDSAVWGGSDRCRIDQHHKKVYGWSPRSWLNCRRCSKEFSKLRCRPNHSKQPGHY